MRARRPASRWWQPELWLVIGIPCAALAGGVATLHAVAGDLSSDGAAEGVHRTAQVQDADLQPDLAAARLGMAATLAVDRARGVVDVRMAGAVQATPATLAFVHRLRADADQRIALHRKAGGGWSMPFVPAANAGWRLVLEGDARAPREAPVHWRLVGTLPPGGTSARLAPAVAAP